jgi:hypothetical protein
VLCALILFGLFLKMYPKVGKDVQAVQYTVRVLSFVMYVCFQRGCAGFA